MRLATTSNSSALQRKNKRIIITDNKLKNSLIEVENLITNTKRAQQHEQHSEPRYNKPGSQLRPRRKLKAYSYIGYGGINGSMGDLYNPANHRNLVKLYHKKKLRSNAESSKIYCVNIKKNNQVLLVSLDRMLWVLLFFN